MQVFHTALPGVLRLEPFRHQDIRGSFVRMFRSSELAAAVGHEVVWHESYVSTSIPGTVRGLHFQLPPHDHWKLVTCLSGQVLDVVVDVRRNATYGQFVSIELHAASGTQVLIPPGCAHGFCVLGDNPATLLYHTSTEHTPSHDTGIRWDSAGIAWPISGTPILSERDQKLPGLADFISPW